MATLDQLTIALRNADAAGDADAAKLFAAEINKMHAAPAAVPPAPVPAATVAGVVHQGMSGVNEGIGNFLGFPVDMANKAIGLGMKGVNAVAGTDLQPAEHPMLGSDSIKGMLTNMGTIAPPSANPVEQGARRVGANVGGTVVPAIMTGGVAPALATLASGVTAGAGGEVARAVAPGNETAAHIGEILGGFTPTGAALALGRGTAAAVPSAEELFRVAGQQANAARDLGVEFSAPAVARTVQNARAALEGDGLIAELAPRTHAIIDRLTNPPPGAVAPYAGIDAARRRFQRLSINPQLDGEEREAAGRMVRTLDEFVQNPGAGNVLAGSADDVARLNREYRGNWAAASRSDTITGTERAADLRAAASNSGRNIDNSIRQRIASLLLNERDIQGFSQVERDALQGVTEGTRTRNRVRNIGNLLGGGGGLGALLTGGAGSAVGAGSGGMTGAAIGGLALPAVGVAAKSLGNVLTRRALGGADELVRSRSPLYAAAQGGQQAGALTPERMAVIRALLASEAARLGATR